MSLFDLICFKSDLKDILSHCELLSMRVCVCLVRSLVLHTEPLHAGPQTLLQVHHTTVELLVVQSSQLFLQRPQQLRHICGFLFELLDQQSVCLVRLQNRYERTQLFHFSFDGLRDEEKMKGR